MDQNRFQQLPFSSGHDVLSFFRDKPVHDVLNPDNYGLVFRSPDPANYYVFQIGSQGDYIVLYYLKDSGFTFLTDFLTDSAIVPEGPNQLSVRAVGPELTFMVNGKQLTVIKDGTLSQGQVGLWVSQGDGEPREVSVVDFDNFKLTEP